MVEAGVCDNGETGCGKDSGREDEERKGSVLVNITSSSWGKSDCTCRRNGAIDGGRERGGRREK